MSDSSNLAQRICDFINTTKSQRQDIENAVLNVIASMMTDYPPNKQAEVYDTVCRELKKLISLHAASKAMRTGPPPMIGNGEPRLN